MHRQAINFTSALCVFAALGLSACDAGPDEAPEILAELEAEDPDLDIDSLPVVDPDAFDELAPANFAAEQPEAEAEAETESGSCSLNLPAHVYAGPSKQRTVSGQIFGIPTGTYFMDAVRSFPWLSYWSIKAGNTIVAALNQPGGLFVGTDGTPIEVLLQAPSGAVPGGVYDLEVRLYTISSQLACTDHVTLEIADCGQVDWWATGTWPTPWYDNANCYVDSLPSLPAGVSSFVYGNSWYVTPTNGNQCAAGVYDGANCYIGSAPWGQTAFIYDDNLYYQL